ncbi:MAG TPA: SpoIIE family protein phosphatase [Bacteroidales bacterium]|nr:SpoIIE family protein phosphatase [Bacteroidales bacterium]
MKDEFYIEVGSFQRNHTGERICGDSFASQKVKEEKRTVVVLSDGMGHGVKANLLSTITATMALNFTKEHKDSRKIADIILNTLPVCSERKISYATFSIIDIEESGKTTIINYDNPTPIVLRDKKLLELTWTNIMQDRENTAGKEIMVCTFNSRKEDRIVLMSDGVTQSGLGKGKFMLGWGHDNVAHMLLESLEEKFEISADKLASRLVNKAHANDNYQAKDDISAVVVYLREPRNLLLCSGPPFDKEKDRELAAMVRDFEGKKIICGGTTASIIGHELNITIKDSLNFEDPDLPPVSYMEGIDLVTEGILTLSKVSEILDKFSPRTDLGTGPADSIVKMFLEVDSITFVVGTAINVAHQDPNLPVELEIRRTVIKKIVQSLEKKFLKETNIQFV